MSATNRGNTKRKERDAYFTPQWCIDCLLKTLLKNPPHFWTELYHLHIIDAGSGDGRIGNTIKQGLDKAYPTNPKKLTLIDLEPTGQNEDPNISIVKDDFLKFDVLPEEKILIVSNPPFSNSFSFVKHFIELLDKSLAGSMACVLLRLNWLGSIKRLSFLRENPPSSVFVLSPRPSFSGGKTDATEYAWVIWEKTHSNLEPFEFISKYDK